MEVHKDQFSKRKSMSQSEFQVPKIDAFHIQDTTYQTTYQTNSIPKNFVKF